MSNKLFNPAEKSKILTDEELEKLKLIEKTRIDEKDINDLIKKEFNFKIFDNDNLIYDNYKKLEFDKFRKLFKNSKLVELIFKYYIECDRYGDLFYFVLDGILNDSESFYEYDYEKIFMIILRAFKDRFSKGFCKFFEEYHSNIEENETNNSKSKYSKYGDFFERELHSKFLNKTFSFHNIDEFFGKIAWKLINNKWLDAIELFFDTCSIELDKDVSFFILIPIETEINYIFPRKSNENESKKISWFKHYRDNMHPLYKIRKLDSEKILSHNLVSIGIHEKWFYFGRFLYTIELLLFVAFLVFFSLNANKLYKDYSKPDWFEWPALAFVILFLIYEIFEIIILKTYYFFAFFNFFEWITYILCLLALLTPMKNSSGESNINFKTSVYSFSLLSAYLCFILRWERSILIGTYVYAFRKILIKTFRASPLVLIMFVGFYNSILVRSRFESEVGKERTNNEIGVFDVYLSNSIIETLLMFLGNIKVEKFGLGTVGVDSITFINYLLLNAFIILIPIFLFNLFIGIAVDEVSDILQKGTFHILKVTNSKWDVNHRWKLNGKNEIKQIDIPPVVIVEDLK
ncbi:unnamed protein product [Brachionus calyciflorus]|uniref:Ion transport domain-containing protein n=1 Tax=Brachionus calyciflorus TaxID=104777 RepID=A0A814AQ48_9BILA|nr:unnamed protein product [Brachionus calyciflorus]